MSNYEHEQLRQQAVERMIAERAGSYQYLCRVEGFPVFTHSPIGTVLRHLR